MSKENHIRNLCLLQKCLGMIKNKLIKLHQETLLQHLSIHEQIDSR